MEKVPSTSLEVATVTVMAAGMAQTATYAASNVKVAAHRMTYARHANARRVLPAHFVIL